MTEKIVEAWGVFRDGKLEKSSKISHKMETMLTTGYGYQVFSSRKAAKSYQAWLPNRLTVLPVKIVIPD